jgi:cell shape-determining protein MreC
MKRLFVGRKTCEDRFTIITDYDGEIGVKENRSGDVLVLKHSDLNAQQFVAQLVVFLNDQNQAIVDLFDGSKYWSDKATEKIKELEKENEQLKKQLESEHTMLDNAILLERTRMGQNSLKQYKEAIQ